MNWKLWLGINFFVSQARLSFPIVWCNLSERWFSLSVTWGICCYSDCFSSLQGLTNIHIVSLYFFVTSSVCSRSNTLRTSTHQNKQKLKMLCDVQSLWRQLVPQSLPYTEEINTIILCIISPAKHCRLFLSTNGFFALAAERNFSCIGNRTCLYKLQSPI